MIKTKSRMGTDVDLFNRRRLSEMSISAKPLPKISSAELGYQLRLFAHLAAKSNPGSEAQRTARYYLQEAIDEAKRRALRVLMS